VFSPTAATGQLDIIDGLPAKTGLFSTVALHLSVHLPDGRAARLRNTTTRFTGLYNLRRPWEKACLTRRLAAALPAAAFSSGGAGGLGGLLAVLDAGGGAAEAAQGLLDLVPQLLVGEALSSRTAGSGGDPTGALQVKVAAVNLCQWLSEAAGGEGAVV